MSEDTPGLINERTIIPPRHNKDLQVNRGDYWLVGANPPANVAELIPTKPGMKPRSSSPPLHQSTVDTRKYTRFASSIQIHCNTGSHYLFAADACVEMVCLAVARVPEKYPQCKSRVALYVIEHSGAQIYNFVIIQITKRL